MKNNVVAIRCCTYNHEPYIRDALEGFVMQKTDFPFVAIVHDDASTDRTAEIIREYAEKYPDIIKPIYETENQYSKRDGSLARIMNKACEATGAKYIAMCEGDDYWTDPLKLQKQVDFLESHPDYSMCFHGVEVINVGTKVVDQKCSSVKDKDYNSYDILYNWSVPTCAAMLKKDCVLYKPVDPDFIVGDNVLWASCLLRGKIRGISDKMGIYRRIMTGWTAVSQKDKHTSYNIQLKWIDHYTAMKKHFPEIEVEIFNKKIMEGMAYITLNDFIINKLMLITHIKTYYKSFGYKYLFQIFKIGFKSIWHRFG